MPKRIRAMICQDHVVEWRDKIPTHPHISSSNFRPTRQSEIEHYIDRVHRHNRRRDREDEWSQLVEPAFNRRLARVHSPGTPPLMR